MQKGNLTEDLYSGGQGRRKQMEGGGWRTKTVDMSFFRAIARSGMTGHERKGDSRGQLRLKMSTQ